MRTVITISLNGNAYQLDAAGYEALRAYLRVAEQRLDGNPDQTEILADLEQAIADKCGRYLRPHKNVVSAEEVAVVLKEMGPVDGGASEAAAHTVGVATGEPYVAAAQGTAAGQNDSTGGAPASGGSTGEAPNGETGHRSPAGTPGGASGPEERGSAGTAGSFGANYRGAAGQGGGPGGAGVSGAGGDGSSANTSGSAGAASGTSNSAEPAKRLYLIREGALIAGVCKGLAAYLNIDVSIVRVVFVLVALLSWGGWILIYLVMMFAIPYAETSEQHAAAHGWPFNAEELVARAKAHYAQFRDNEKFRRQEWREQRRMWKFQRKQWKEQRRDWEGWGSANGVPPPMPGWVGQQPSNPTSQVMHGVLSPIVELLGAVLFITFLIALFTLIARHTIFGWWLPHEVPWWLGIVILAIVYRAIAAPLHRARYAAYYGAPFAYGWVALWGALVWVALLGFLSWLAWQHWPDVQEAFQQILQGWRQLLNLWPAHTADSQDAAIYFGTLAAVPAQFLHRRARRRELQAHRQINGADMLGQRADPDVIHSGLGDLPYGLERNAAGGFDFRRPLALAIQGNRRAHIRRAELVEQDDVRTRSARFLEFRQRLDFNFDLHRWRNTARLRYGT